MGLLDFLLGDDSSSNNGHDHEAVYSTNTTITLMKVAK